LNKPASKPTTKPAATPEPTPMPDTAVPEPVETPKQSPFYDLHNWDNELRLRVRSSLSPAYKALVRDWESCERCPLHGTRENVLFARGSLPADVVFVNEHPTSLDDSDGFPLAGPLGRLFDTVMREVERHKPGWTWAVVEPLGCVPWQQIETSQYKHSTTAELTPCDPRFLSLLRLANPTGIVLLGRNVENYWVTNGPRINVELGRKIPTCFANHPRDVLRQGGASQSNETYLGTIQSIKRFVFNTLNLGK